MRMELRYTPGHPGSRCEGYRQCAPRHVLSRYLLDRVEGRAPTLLTDGGESNAKMSAVLGIGVGMSVTGTDWLSCRDAVVAVVPAADFRDGHNASGRRRRYPITAVLNWTTGLRK